MPPSTKAATFRSLQSPLDSGLVRPAISEHSLMERLLILLVDQLPVAPRLSNGVSMEQAIKLGLLLQLMGHNRDNNQFNQFNQFSPFNQSNHPFSLNNKDKVSLLNLYQSPTQTTESFLSWTQIKHLRSLPIKTS